MTGAAIEQLLFTTDWLTGVRGAANATLTEQAGYAYGLAYALSGGGELHPDAHSTAVANLLHSMTPGIVALALHHLRPLLPDLSDQQWSRIDAAAVVEGHVNRINKLKRQMFGRAGFALLRKRVLSAH
ncbi:hypothetical protein AB0M64_16225 [Streptomyces sp. NPDC051771]|uniref:hypothetical protein n=1 Tax=Streptomyces sp. NPDC051771 TaxID=3154847 RepID=UPI00343E8320